MSAVMSNEQARVSLSLIICTYNRAEFLRELLESVEREQTDQLNMETIVVDNNCKDRTPEIVEEFVPRIRKLSREKETKQGLSHARNKGASVATGDFIIYIDDDAILSEGFLERLEIVLRRFDPDLFGGPVLPRILGEVPDWFDPKSEIRQFEKLSGFSEKGSISGGNFGIKKKILDELGPFNTELGMSGDEMAFGEDREMVERYRASRPSCDHRLYYAVELPILHHVVGYKYNKKYQYRRKYDNAAAQEVIFIQTGKRSLTRSLFLAIAHFPYFPIFAIRLVQRRGVGANTYYALVRHFFGICGRLVGVLSYIGRGFKQSFRGGRNKNRKAVDG